MDKIQLYSTVFDAACFLLAHMDLYDSMAIDLNDFRKILRIIIRDSATAKVIAVESQLGLKDSSEDLK